MDDLEFKDKYLKYKKKYLDLKREMSGGAQAAPATQGATQAPVSQTIIVNGIHYDTVVLINSPLTLYVLDKLKELLDPIFGVPDRKVLFVMQCSNSIFTKSDEPSVALLGKMLTALHEAKSTGDKARAEAIEEQIKKERLANATSDLYSGISSNIRFNEYKTLTYDNNGTQMTNTEKQNNLVAAFSALVSYLSGKEGQYKFVYSSPARTQRYFHYKKANLGKRDIPNFVPTDKVMEDLKDKQAPEADYNKGLKLATILNLGLDQLGITAEESFDLCKYSASFFADFINLLTLTSEHAIYEPIEGKYSVNVNLPEIQKYHKKELTLYNSLVLSPNEASSFTISELKINAENWEDTLDTFLPRATAGRINIPNLIITEDKLANDIDDVFVSQFSNLLSSNINKINATWLVNEIPNTPFYMDPWENLASLQKVAGGLEKKNAIIGKLEDKLKVDSYPPISM